MNTIKQTFNHDDMKAFEPNEKVGLMASINPEGLPHITMITSMRAGNPQQLLVGEFVTGNSKKFIQHTKNIAFLIMTFEKHMWRGKAKWTHLAKSGPEYEIMNNTPMFRYNTYFGINTVYYFDLVETTGRTSLSMPAVIREAVFTRISKGRARTGDKNPILKPFVEGMFNQLSSLKFLSYVGNDGFPQLIPIIQCQAADSRRLAFSTGLYRDELNAIPAGAKVAVFCMNMGIEMILVRGTFNGYSNFMGVRLGTLDVDWVYNSNPPAIGQVYPEVPLKALVDFK